jgi:uncharacterized protein YjbJ (UPF0337 family)
MSSRTQRIKGAANEAVGKTKGTISHARGDHSGKAKAAGQVAKGKAQKAAGKARKRVAKSEE